MYPLLLDKTSERGFCMKYDYAFKLNAVELYRSGQWIETPEGISQKNCTMVKNCRYIWS